MPLPKKLPRALTVAAPFALAIATGRKRVENRSRPTAYRGPVLIHAGVGRAYVGEPCDRWAARYGVAPDALVYGAIIGIAELVDCVPVQQIAGRSAEPLVVGPWCWLFADARMLTSPVPARGQLGLWGFPYADATPRPIKVLDPMGGRPWPSFTSRLQPPSITATIS